ncbi:hypothetical protein MBLNU459_g7578t1 [Dothideomycetes sp. NU459]
MDLDSREPVDDRGASAVSPLHPVKPTKDGMEPTAQPPVPSEIERIRKKAAKRKKRNKLMAPAAPALNVIRGFHTPVTSGGEESDGSVIGSPLLTPRMASLGGSANSPRLTPSASSSGISALKLQLDALHLDRASPRPRLTRELSNASGFESTPTSSAASDSDKTEMDTYEVNFEQDFVSPDACAKLGTQTPLATVEGGLRTQSALRKMTASDFEPLRCLGKGAFGTVHLVKHNTTGRLYAQKQFRKATLTVHKRLVEQTRAERTILESVNRHPFVVKLFYAFQDHEKLYLILEYAQGGELFTHLAMERMFSEETAAFYMAEMVLALEHLHTNVRVVYRDLKPENCLLDSDGHLLLTDFGLSKVALEEEDQCNSILGTIEYMAPEVIQGTSYGMAVDWWSLGAIGFDLLTGAPPFQGNNHAKIQQNILKQKLQLPYFLGPDAKDLLTRLLRKEPGKRLGADMPKDLHLIKKHRFFRRIDWRKLGRRELEPPIQPLITDPELAENFSKEFTDLPMSPVVERNMMNFPADGPANAGAVGANGCVVASTNGDVDMTDPFGGFSFVASQSLLDTEEFMV